jgi:hypothetical protein
MEELRVCTKCLNPKPIDCFSYSGLIGHGGRPGKSEPNKGQKLRRTVCKRCHSQLRRRRPTTLCIRAAQIEVMLKNARRRNKPGENYDLNAEWLRSRLAAGVCEITGLVFDHSKRIFKPSLDRIDPQKGYTKDNCRLVCLGFNTMRMNSSDGDTLKLAKAIVAASDKLSENVGVICSLPRWAGAWTAKTVEPERALNT